MTEPSPSGKGLGEGLPSSPPGHQTQPANTLAKLLTWLSPAFPTGAFAYSHGLEWAVEANGLTSEAALIPWLDDILRHGSGHTDAILLRHAHRAETRLALQDIADLAQATQPSRERRDETLGQGTAFAIAARVWGAPLLEAIPHPVAYPVALGALARAHAIDKDDAAIGLLHAFTANLVGAAVRLIPLGQTAGLRALAALDPTIHDVAAQTRHAVLDDIGSACFRADLASMRHETQYTRLFRT